MARWNTTKASARTMRGRRWGEERADFPPLFILTALCVHALQPPARGCEARLPLSTCSLHSVFVIFRRQCASIRQFPFLLRKFWLSGCLFCELSTVPVQPLINLAQCTRCVRPSEQLRCELHERWALGSAKCISLGSIFPSSCAISTAIPSEDQECRTCQGHRRTALLSVGAVSQHTPRSSLLPAPSSPEIPTPWSLDNWEASESPDPLPSDQRNAPATEPPGW